MRGSLMAVLSFYLGAFILAVPVRASESALSVSPAILESVVTQEARTLKTINLQNMTAFPLPIHGQAAPFLAQELLPTGSEATFDSSAWIKLEPADFILQPHAHQEVKLIIQPPAGVEPGGHYATVFFQPLIPAEALGPNTASLARVGVLTFLVVPGKIDERLTLGSFTTNNFFRRGPIPLSLTLDNPGTIHLLPQITVNIKDKLLNREPTTLTLPPSAILPGTRKTFVATWEPSPFTLGFFQAELSVYYGSNTSPLTATTSFWLIPWIPILLLSLPLTLFVYLFIFNYRRVKLAWRVLTSHEPINNDHLENASHNRQTPPTPRRRLPRAPHHPHSS